MRPQLPDYLIDDDDLFASYGVMVTNLQTNKERE